VDFPGFLQWLEASALGHAMRSSGVWTYAIVNLFHIVGIALLFGAIVLLDLRLLGFWRSVKLASLSRPAVTVAGAGVALAVLTGIPMFATKATDYGDNVFLFLKFALVGLALLNVLALHRSPAWRAQAAGQVLTAGQERRLALAAAGSLVLWFCAITCGRLAGYW
jgi:hypothetical protein